MPPRRHGALAFCFRVVDWGEFVVFSLIYKVYIKVNIKYIYSTAGARNSIRQSKVREKRGSE